MRSAGRGRIACREISILSILLIVINNAIIHFLILIIISITSYVRNNKMNHRPNNKINLTYGENPPLHW
jgi:hypothetical protein